MDLTEYQANVLGLLNDPLYQFYSSTNVTRWINQARTEVAKQTGCIRLLCPSSAPVISVTVTAGGIAYNTATVTISGPDAINGSFVTAMATATILAGSVTSITVTNGGTGYVLNPTVTITGDGTGATATATVGPHLTTTAGQEVYTHATALAILRDYTDGIQAVIGIMGVAASWGAVRPNLDYWPWEAFQAYARSINQGQSWPSIWSYYARGEAGSIYLFPIPSGTYEMQWDCFCTPQALSVIQTTDAIPDNWTAPVFYYACYLAYMNAQRKDDSDAMFERYRRAMAESAMYSTPPITPTYYPSDY